MIRQLFIFSFIFLILAPYNNLLPIPIFPIAILSLFLMLTRMNINQIVFKSHMVILLLLMFHSLLLLAYFSYLYNNSDSPNYIVSLLRMIITLIVIGFAISYIPELSLNDVKKAIIIAASVNALVVIYQMLIEYYELNLPDLVLVGIYGGDLLHTSYRKPGLLSGYPITAILSFIGFCFLFERNFKLNSIIRSFLMLILILSIVFSGRTGFWILIVFLLVVPFISPKYFIKSFMILTTGILIFVAVFTYSGVYFQQIVRTSASLIVAYYETGQVSDYSAEDTISMYSVPDDLSVFLLGNSVPPYVELRADPAFMQWLYGNGIFSMVILSMAGILIVGFLVKNSQSYLALVLFMVFLSNFKGNYLFSKVTSEIYFAILISVIYSSKKSDSKYLN